MTSPDLTNIVWIKKILTNMNILKAHLAKKVIFRHIFSRLVASQKKLQFGGKSGRLRVAGAGALPMDRMKFLWESFGGIITLFFHLSATKGYPTPHTDEVDPAHFQSENHHLDLDAERRSV